MPSLTRTSTGTALTVDTTTDQGGFNADLSSGLGRKSTLVRESGPGRTNAPPSPPLFPAHSPVRRRPVAGTRGVWTRAGGTSGSDRSIVEAR
jgi:hypothetical protein